MDRIAIISPDASEEILGNLVKLGIEPVPLPRTSLVQGPIAGHPDIQVFVFGNRVFCHPDIEPAFRARVEKQAEVIICGTRLRAAYPGDVPYNIACTGSRAFHHRALIDPVVKDFLGSAGVDCIGVSQGYAKCSTLIIGEDALVTADASIHAAAAAAGIDSLRIRPGHIDLPGYAYGFIGGATGLAGDTVLLTGTLEHHPDYGEIAAHASAQGKTLVPLGRERAIDLGSILVV